MVTKYESRDAILLENEFSKQSGIDQDLSLYETKN